MEYCSIDYIFDNVDLVGVNTYPELAHKNYKFVNPAGAIPMIVHDGFRIMGNIDNFLKYLVNQFPDIKSQLFGRELDHDLMDRYLAWISKILEVQTQQIQNLFVKDSVPQSEKKEKFEIYENIVLKKLEKSLKDQSKSDFFSAS